MSALAEAVEVTRRFGRTVTVRSVSLAVAEGEVVGLLGANGAGKTTLIRMLLGLLPPSSGEVRLFGAPPSTAGRRRVGYVPQTLGLYSDLTVAENWRFTARAFGRPSGSLPRSLRTDASQLVGTLPLGKQRQVAFAVALAHGPELLVLDEPTSGVGPLARARSWERIRAAAEQGAGVLVTTHNMEEAQECDRLFVMAAGRRVAAGTAAAIIGGHRAVEVRAPDWQRAFGVLDGAGFDVRVHAGALRLGPGAAAVSEQLARHGIDAEVRTVPADLEEAFVAIVSGEGAQAL
jgi:ABC-2 type transport system ATP-binding protein/ribosome-dependent ATPase